MIRRFTFACLFIGLSSLGFSSVSVNYETVEAKGWDATEQSAINAAIVEALGRVNGKNISASNQLKSLSQSINNNGQKSRMSQKEIEKAYAEATNGMVASYDVLDVKPDGRGQYQALVRAKILKVNVNLNDKRKRIGVVPFRLAGVDFLVNDRSVDKQQVNRILSQSFVSQLVQTRKFTVLDREYMAEIVGEKNRLLSGSNASIEDIARLGVELSADYLIVGSLENVNYSTQIVHSRLTGSSSEVGEGNFEVSYRIIDIATKQIKFADFARLQISRDDIAEIDQSRRLENVDSAMCEIAAERITQKIMGAIYPMLITKVRGNSVYLNQGGDSLSVGDVFEVFEYGERQYDPYTNESLGREEFYIGTIEVRRVNPKSAQGNIVEQEIDFAEVFAPKTLVCRAPAVSEPGSNQNWRKSSSQVLGNGGVKLPFD
jgi:curli biogenesis system outer membrane secretion channel CsgG